MLEGIIFDLDGVLVSTDEYHYKAWKKIADDNGWIFNRKINERLRGVSRMDSLEIILKENNVSLSEEEKERLASQKNEIYRESLKNLNPDSVDKDIVPMLKDLHENGLKLAVGSSSKNTKFILERIGLTPYFDAVADGNVITHSKPNPEVFLKAAEMIGLKPAVCAIVEDAEAGIDAGKNGGFLTFGIQGASEYKRTDVPVTDISDLWKKIKERRR